MDKERLKELRAIASKATQGAWRFLANIPFYVDVEKPAPSMSKYDDKRPTYWRYEDGLHVANFQPIEALQLLDYIDELEKKLEENKK
jgi:hypothetical protein